MVTLSSIGHRLGGIDFDDMHYTQKPYEKWSAYGQSKTAKSLLAVHLDALEQGNGIRAFAVHPGGIFTPLQRHLANEEMVVLGWTNEDGTPSERAASFFKTPCRAPAQACGAPQPARLTAWAGFIARIATSPHWWQMMMPARPVCGAGRLTEPCRKIVAGHRKTLAAH